MNPSESSPRNRGLSGHFLCTADFEVADGIHELGTSPWGSRRVGHISGGRFSGPALSGVVLPGGGNWSQAGKLVNGDSVGTFDARSVWRTDEGAIITMSYTGRVVVSDEVRRAFAGPSDVDPLRYYLRIAAVFETASPAYDWLNGLLVVGIGQRTDLGVQHQVFQVS